MAIEFHQHKLPNGLTIIAECNDEAHTAAVGFFVKAGARDEELAVMGVSHFLEHMMFKGTDRRSADDVNRHFDEIGANYNAFTSHENTVYWAQVLPEYLAKAVDLIGDMLRPALRGSDFDMEKNVILEEIGMYDDRPQWRLHDTLLENYFGDLALGYRVLGTVESIQKLSVQQMRSYFQTRYGPDNITVAAAGKIDFDRLVSDVSTAANSWATTGASRVYPDHEPTDSDVTIQDERVNRHYVAMMGPGPATQDPRRYAAKVLADVLGDDDGSQLYWALVDPGLADEADFSFYPHDRHGCYLAYASCDPDRAEQVEKILRQTLDQYAQQIDADEIERVKNKLATSATLEGENPGGRMRSLGGQWVYLGQYIPLQEDLQHLRDVTVNDIKQLINDLPLCPRAVVRLTPTT